MPPQVLLHDDQVDHCDTGHDVVVVDVVEVVIVVVVVVVVVGQGAKV